MLSTCGMRRAVIDIGSNTVKLLVADVAHGDLQPVLAKDTATRLGQGVQQAGRLDPAAISRTVNAIANFLAEARRLGAGDCTAITTSAVRRAANRAEFLAAVRDQCGLPVEVISGEREAELIFRGVASDPFWAAQPLLVMDVGGGSAEFIQGRPGQVERLESTPLGAVRLAEEFGEDRFAELSEYLRRALRDRLAHYDHRRRLIGTGGTLTVLARVAQHDPIDHARLEEGELRALVMKLNALPLAERRAVPGLPADRADIIVPGGLVYILAMEALGAFEIVVSTRNLRYGVLLES
jgi:exopolyphosphatase/guanosine-5'-triphosphate,3'-diphosphate pyrophosphatase